MLRVSLLSTYCRICNSNSAQNIDCVNGMQTVPTDTQTEVQRHRVMLVALSSQLRNNKKVCIILHNLNT